ncbi:MAG: YihY/virulence factor BrkB family protein [Pseudomonadota bacterium]
MSRERTLTEAIYRLYEHSQFSMASAVAFSFLVSLFPFCMLLGSLAGIFGGSDLAQQAITHLFQILPEDVAKELEPRVLTIMTTSRIDLLTFGGAVMMFFATTAIETLRTALNLAYRERETRNYFVCLGLSMLHVLISAIVILALTWMLFVAPGLANLIDSEFVRSFMNSSWMQSGALYAIAAFIVGAQLCSVHLYLAAGRRTLSDIWPGITLTIVLWLAIGWLYSYYLSYSNYELFYASLSQIMTSLIFFQITAIAIILGAELNRGIISFRQIHSDNHKTDKGSTA